MTEEINSKQVCLLRSEVVFLERQGVDKLDGAPEPMELCALVHVHHPVDWLLPLPHRVVKETTDAGQHHLKHAQAAAQTLPRQKVALTRVGQLLWKQRQRSDYGNVWLTFPRKQQDFQC